MTAVGFTSFIGSPGVTTFSTLMVSAASAVIAKGESGLGVVDSVLVEADPVGSKAALHYQLDTPSFLNFALDTSAVPDWREHAVRLSGGENVLSVTGSPVAASNLLASSAEKIFGLLSDDSKVLAVADLGRLHVGHPNLAAVGGLDSVVVLINRFSNSDIVFSSNSIKDLLGSGVEVGWGVVGKRGQTNEAIERHSGIQVVAEIPNDSSGADGLFDRPSRWVVKRSELAHSARTFVKSLLSNQVMFGGVS